MFCWPFLACLILSCGGVNWAMGVTLCSKRRRRCLSTAPMTFPSLGSRSRLPGWLYVLLSVCLSAGGRFHLRGCAPPPRRRQLSGGRLQGYTPVLSLFLSLGSLVFSRWPDWYPSDEIDAASTDRLFWVTVERRSELITNTIPIVNVTMTAETKLFGIQSGKKNEPYDILTLRHPVMPI